MLEPAGRRLLAEIDDGQGARVLDIGCGALGWLRLLSEWVGPDGQVVGTDIQDEMLAAARQFVTAEGLGNVAPWSWKRSTPPPCTTSRPPPPSTSSNRW